MIMVTRILDYFWEKIIYISLPALHNSLQNIYIDDKQIKTKPDYKPQKQDKWIYK